MHLVSNKQLRAIISESYARGGDDLYESLVAFLTRTGDKMQEVLDDPEGPFEDELHRHREIGGLIVMRELVVMLKSSKTEQDFQKIVDPLEKEGFGKHPE